MKRKEKEVKLSAIYLCYAAVGSHSANGLVFRSVKYIEKERGKEDEREEVNVLRFGKT